MRLEQLEYLIEISNTRSISLASKNLHITQQSLSKAIQNLEEELQATLLDRSSKGVTLTKEGKETVLGAKKIFQDLDELKYSLQPLAQRPSHTIHGSLHILHTNVFDLNLITHSLQQFSTAYPNITVSINQMAMTNIFTSIIAGEIDLGLVALTNDYTVNKAILGDDIDKLHFFPLSEDKLLVAVSKLSPLSKNKSISISSILKHPLIMLQHENNDGMEKNWLHTLLKLYGAPNFVLLTNDLQLYLNAIANGTGLGFFTLSAHLSNNYLITEDIVLLPFREPIQLFYNYVLSCHPLSTETKAYLPFLTGTAKDATKE